MIQSILYFKKLNFLLYGFPLAFVSFGTNDQAIPGMTPAIFYQRLSYLVTSLKSTGIEVALIAPWLLSGIKFDGSTSALLALWTGMIDAYYRVSYETGSLLVDFSSRWPSFANDTPPSYRGKDNIHPSALGNTDIMGVIWQVIRYINAK